MATVTQDLSATTFRKLSVARLAATGALTALAFFVLCWIAAILPLGNVSHMYVQLFTTAQVSSGTALVEGAVWSIAFGLIAGALVAFFYNALRFLDRR